MSAAMWEVVRQRNVKHYGKLEEFVSMVTDAVPELMSKREGRLLSLGLRARVRHLKCLNLYVIGYLKSEILLRFQKLLVFQQLATIQGCFKNIFFFLNTRAFE